MRDVRCKECDHDVSDLAATDPCPNCGSTSRVVSVTFQITAKAEVRLKTHSKHEKLRKKGRWLPSREVYAGDDQFRKTGRRTILYRLIDRLNDLYVERIKDAETGEIIVDKSHRLSDHRGCGSARNKREEPQ